ncbi:hypothetical protein KVF89_23420 [Nocardioides carbamazepini]|uniref:hypothetical protein n=1 Tax=Nocardioides carbamazepini TaxID=2854259 RepID=UPI002149EA24|nr:hypothetical protein [Nocardioides carbamazepini]MCR1785508.1 hypothetical protein [Nocardioides carbamazepini]
MSIPRDTGEPDAFMKAVNARQLQRVRRRIRVALPLEVLTVVATVAILLLTDAHWSWVLFGAATATSLVGAVLVVSDDDAERPRPGTDLEVAVVVGVEIADWGNAGADDQHRVRVIARPLGSATSELVHGDHRFRAGDGWSARPGTLIGIRRFPTMKHLVRLERCVDPVALVRLREPVRGGSVLEDADVVSLRVTGEPDGDWWPTEVTVRTADRLLLVSECRRLPEELGPLEPGTAVRIVRDQRDPFTRPTRCAILPSGDTA